MRLIDADALFEFAKTEEGAEILDHSVFKVLLLRRILDKAPTIEAEPVRHGEWVKPSPYSQAYCNQCCLTPKTVAGILPKYCPNCGAKMDGGEKE